MPVAARQLLRSASAADVRGDMRVHEKTERGKQPRRVLMLQSDVDYLRSALHFSETQHFMLRLPIWKDLVREVNKTVGCGCAACRWNGLVAVDGEQECGPTVDSFDIVKSTECALQLKLLKLLSRLRVSVHVADKPQRVPGVDAGALRAARTDVFCGNASVVVQNQTGTPCFFDATGFCSGWGQPVTSFADVRLAEMDCLIKCAEGMRFRRLNASK